MKAQKKVLAVLLAALQLALSFSFGGYEALAAQVVTGAHLPVTVTPSGVSAAARGGTLSLSPTLLPLSGVSLSPLSPQAVLSPTLTVAPALTAAPQAAEALLHAEVPLLSQALVEAPALASPEVREAFQSAGFRQDAPVERAQNAGATLFAALRGERLNLGAAGQDAAATRASSAQGARNRPALSRAAPSKTDTSLPVPAPKPAPAAKASFWRKPAVRVAVAGAAVAAAWAALPLLAGHVAAVAAAGSITLSVIGLPQIVKNFKSDREGMKDLAIASPLLWFAAAVLLSTVSIGQGSSLWWNAANLAGVAESAVVVGQINNAKKDPKALKATLLTALAVLAPLPLLATGVLIPVSTGMTVAFTAAMGLLWVLNWPQVRQNYRLFKEEGRPPKGIAPLYPALVALGSGLHLYAALMGGDLRWALNAVIAIVTAGMVLGQIYFPRASNAVVGPLVELADRLLPGRKAPDAAALKAQAEAVVSKLFAGSELKAFKGEAPAERMSEILTKASALPGRSVIYLEAPTAAGKSTLAESLKATLGGRIKVFPVDAYFNTGSDVPRAKDGTPDYDRPEALNLARAGKDIESLLAGKRVELPDYDMKTATTRFDSGRFLELGADEILIVDSIYASHKTLLDASAGSHTLNVFLYAPAVVRLARRLLRDRKERGVSLETNLKSWGRILDNERDFILPLRDKADVQVNLVGEEELGKLTDVYAGLLAEEWSARGQEPAITALFSQAIEASLKADAQARR